MSSDTSSAETPSKCPFTGCSDTIGAPKQSKFESGDSRRLVQIPQDINIIFALPREPRHAPYADLKPGHRERMNDVLHQLVNEGPLVEDGIVKAKELLSQGVNPDLMRHAFGIYLTHSRDAQARHIVIPPLKYHALLRSINQSTVQGISSSPESLSVVPGEVVTPDTFMGPALLSYWREDYDYNDHHVHWHMVFPGTGVVVDGKNVRVIDRQGELFLYMHSQMVARYETEGICWDLPLVRPWNQYDDILEHGYTPVPALAEYYGAYPAFSGWYAIRNPNIPDVPDAPVPRATLETWRDNIYRSIKDGEFWLTNENKEQKSMKLTGDNIHDVVGGIVEAESRDLQTQSDGYYFDDQRYGNLHNFGHDKFAEMGYHSYLYRKNPYSLMISNFGSPRDSAFWPWHKHIQYFGRLAAAKYTQDITEHRAAVKLSKLVFKPQDEDSPHYNDSEPGIVTQMGPPAVNLMESKAKLDHEPYKWSVKIQSTRTDPLPSVANPQIITLRLFIVAKALIADYHNWIEMDKVTVKLTSDSTITNIRLDTDSAVARKMGNYSELDPKYTSAWCRCGWPQNMMLPVGKPEGMPFVAFCMATDDVLSTDNKTAALSYCGASQSNRKYPDPRGMGYPFNREWTQQRDSTASLSIADIISDNKTYPFMATSTFKIYRTTKPFVDDILNPIVPIAQVTWEDPIKTYFTNSDVICMKKEYGYDMSSYFDVALHGEAILDATANKRMPLQMPPYTQENPDPKHPLWTSDMVSSFRAWLLQGCPKGIEPPLPPTPPQPPTKVTWDNTIKNYFLPEDLTCMQQSFDLGKKEDVTHFASQIYDAVKNKTMPLQMAPYTQSNPDPKHPLWTDEMCQNFYDWWKAGSP